MLGVTLGDLFIASEATDVAVIRADVRPSFRSPWSKARIEAVMPFSAGRSLEAMMATLEPGGTSGNRPTSGALDQLAVIFVGQLTLTLSGEQIALHRGDAVLYAHEPLESGTTRQHSRSSVDRVLESRMSRERTHRLTISESARHDHSACGAGGMSPLGARCMSIFTHSSLRSSRPRAPPGEGRGIDRRVRRVMGEHQGDRVLRFDARNAVHVCWRGLQRATTPRRRLLAVT